ncbi:hypothetical protein M514_19282 [Trichuris suis]|uniref:Uncharacterized protein n=1 Tax=Trichuris suis TaxID=68888 RepID=A0A085NG60_9BILA|nr:hypothetical protein M514_19282 [Trichuris suis]
MNDWYFYSADVKTPHSMTLLTSRCRFNERSPNERLFYCSRFSAFFAKAKLHCPKALSQAGKKRDRADIRAAVRLLIFGLAAQGALKCKLVDKRCSEYVICSISRLYSSLMFTVISLMICKTHNNIVVFRAYGAFMSIVRWRFRFHASTFPGLALLLLHKASFRCDTFPWRIFPFVCGHTLRRLSPLHNLVLVQGFLSVRYVTADYVSIGFSTFFI